MHMENGLRGFLIFQLTIVDNCFLPQVTVGARSRSSQAESRCSVPWIRRGLHSGRNRYGRPGRKRGCRGCCCCRHWGPESGTGQAQSQMSHGWRHPRARHFGQSRIRTYQQNFVHSRGPTCSFFQRLRTLVPEWCKCLLVAWWLGADSGRWGPHHVAA